MARTKIIPGVSVMTLTVIACLLLSANASYGNIAANIEMHAGDFETVSTKTIFKIHPHDGEQSNETAEGFSGGELIGGTILDKDASGTTLLEMGEEEPEYIKITLPSEDGEDMTLWLYHAEIFSDGAQICYTSEEGDKCETAEQKGHYWGIVEGRVDDSLAACSLQDSEYACLVSVGDDTFVLGNMGDTGSEVFYNTKDLHGSPAVEYGVLDNPMTAGQGPTIAGMEDNTSVDDPCVTLYVEVEYDIYQHHNSDEAATREWVEAAFAEVFALYANDGIRVTIKSMKIWTSDDGYPTSGSGSKLDDFTSRLNGEFDGDLAHLISYDGGGGIAYLDVLCYPWYGTGYSGLSTSYSKAPLFSWTVEVIAHEIGHNLGSPHTHSCSWGPNGNEAIDCCGADAGYNECSGSCNAASDPVDGGTIMSYCHLTSTGINFNHGFGPYPVERMTGLIKNASCLSTCDKGGDDDCQTYYRDADGDGYGSPTDAVESCDGTVPDGYLDNSDDCDDTVATMYKGAPCTSTEGCKGTLNANCTCESTEEVGTWYEDSDGDGFGNPEKPLITCDPPSNYVQNKADCDDNNASIYPGAICESSTAKECYGEYDDSCVCNVNTDAARDIFRDNDGDGFGDPNNFEFRCFSATSGGWVENNQDCNDQDATVWIGAPCDAKEASECGGRINNECSCEAGGSAGKTRYYADNDRDGYGDPNYWTEHCNERGEFEVDNDLDCDDAFYGYFQGDFCETGTGCSTFLSPSCYCAFLDSDWDGVCDGRDICPDEDDTIDEDDNGIPDCSEEPCTEAEDEFDSGFLRTWPNTPVNDITKEFANPIRNPAFKLENLGQSHSKGWQELVSVFYTKSVSGAAGEEQFFASMTYEELKIINDGMSSRDKNDWNVFIEARDIISIRVQLENGYPDSTKRLRINLGDILYCSNNNGESDGSSVLLETKSREGALPVHKDL